MTVLIAVVAAVTVVAVARDYVQEVRPVQPRPFRAAEQAGLPRTLTIVVFFVAYVVVIRRRLLPFRSTPTLPDLTICITVSCSFLTPSPRCRSVAVDPCPPEAALAGVPHPHTSTPSPARVSPPAVARRA